MRPCTPSPTTAPTSTARRPIRGTLETSKLADLVVLDRNPLAVDPREIRDIQVLATIKEGETLYERDAK